MDMTRYEKADGGFVGAVAHMAKGKAAYTEDEMQYVVDQDGILFYVVDGHGLRESISCFNDLNAMDWYVKKPFDVRQAMRDKPDEWVGAFKNDGEEWYKVGFDTDDFNAVYATFNSSLSVTSDIMVIGFPTKEELDACIPLDEVPADAR